jgi:hypothetical protein
MLPEVVVPGYRKSEAETYIYSVPDTTPPYLAEHEEKQVVTSEARLSWWLRWPALLVAGLFLALLGAIIGGLVGTSIEANKHRNDAIASAGIHGGDTAQIQCATISSTPTSTATSTAARASKTATPSSTPVVTFVPPVFQTNCTNNKDVRKFSSEHTSVTYDMFCGLGWIGNDITALSVLTPSDCIESCATYNENYKGSSGGVGKCVGGGFIPSYVDTRLPMKEYNLPYNCFLKNSSDGRGNNDKSYEVVVLCLDGECD